MPPLRLARRLRVASWGASRSVLAVNAGSVMAHHIRAPIIHRTSRFVLGVAAGMLRISVIGQTNQRLRGFREPARSQTNQVLTPKDRSTGGKLRLVGLREPATKHYEQS